MLYRIVVYNILTVFQLIDDSHSDTMRSDTRCYICLSLITMKDQVRHNILPAATTLLHFWH